MRGNIVYLSQYKFCCVRVRILIKMCNSSYVKIYLVLVILVGIINLFVAINLKYSKDIPPTDKGHVEGTCPSIKTTISEEVLCKLNGRVVSCENPVPNTTATVRCQPFYAYRTNKPTYRCQDGEWDHAFIPCSPECGAQRPAELGITGEYPWVAAIYNATNHQICVGTILTTYHILSAAHCFTDINGEEVDKNLYTIAVGKYHRDINVREPSAQTQKIKRLHVHEQFKGNRQKYRDDIALVELDEELTVSAEVAPVCLDWDNVYEDFDFVDGNEGVITGWGYMQNGLRSNYLKKIAVPYRSRTACLQHLPVDFAQDYFSADKICIGYKTDNTSICQGDSGAGLYFKSDGESWYIRGIVSISTKLEGECNTNRYPLLTKVSKYLRWIEDKTGRI